MSELSLGSMTFGEDWGWGAAKEEAKKIYDAYREAGGNFIDTANVYTQGSSERILGELLSYRDVPVIPIIGARKLSQFEDNLASLSLTLTGEQVKTLDDASQIELGFPQDFFRRDMVRAFVYGGLRDRIVA